MIIRPRRFKQQPQHSVGPSADYRDAALLGLFDGTGRDIAQGNNLSHATAAPARVARPHGYSFNFTGTKRLQSAQGVITGPRYTVFAWVRPAVNNSGFRRILETNYSAGFFLGSNSPGGQYTFIVNNSSPLDACTGGQQVSGQRDFLCGVFDGANRILYVNGVEVDRASASGTGYELKLNVGSNAGGSEAWNGDIDGVGVLRRPLPAAAIWELYQNPFRVLEAPRRRVVVETAPVPGGGFNPAWAKHSNVIIGSGL